MQVAIHWGNGKSLSCIKFINEISAFPKQYNTGFVNLMKTFLKQKHRLASNLPNTGSLGNLSPESFNSRLKFKLVKALYKST